MTRRILVGIKRVVDYNDRVRVKPDGSPKPPLPRRFDPLTSQ